MKKYDLVLKNLDIETLKKLSILLGFDISEQEKKEKEQGTAIKSDAVLLAEIEKTVNDKKTVNKK
jgi:hypothetical protein